MTDVESGAAVRDGKRSGGRTARRNARTGGSSGQVVRPGLPGGQGEVVDASFLRWSRLKSSCAVEAPWVIGVSGRSG